MESISAMFGLQVGFRVETNRADARLGEAQRAQTDGFAATASRVIDAEVVGGAAARRSAPRIGARKFGDAQERQTEQAREQSESRSASILFAGGESSAEVRGIYSRSGYASVALIPLSAPTLGLYVDLYA